MQVGLLDRDLFDGRGATGRVGAMLGAGALLAETLGVVLHQRAKGEKRLVLDRLPLLPDLGRGGGAQDVHGAADRTPLDALVRGPTLRSPLVAALVFLGGHRRRS